MRLAVFVATTVAPVVDLQVVHCRVPRWVAMSVALSLVAVVLALFGVALIAAVQAVVNVAHEYSEQVAALTGRLFAVLKAHDIKVNEASVSASSR